MRGPPSCSPPPFAFAQFSPLRCVFVPSLPSQPPFVSRSEHFPAPPTPLSLTTHQTPPAPLHPCAPCRRPLPQPLAGASSFPKTHMVSTLSCLLPPLLAWGAPAAPSRARPSGRPPPLPDTFCPSPSSPPTSHLETHPFTPPPKLPSTPALQLTQALCTWQPPLRPRTPTPSVDFNFTLPTPFSRAPGAPFWCPPGPPTSPHPLPFSARGCRGAPTRQPRFCLSWGSSPLLWLLWWLRALMGYTYLPTLCRRAQARAPAIPPRTLRSLSNPACPHFVRRRACRRVWLLALTASAYLETALPNPTPLFSSLFHSY